MIAMVEKDLLQKLGFNLNYTTSLEFLLQILFLEQEDETEEFSTFNQIQNLLEQVIPIIYICQKDYNIGCANSQLSIGLASLIWILNQKQESRSGSNDAHILMNYQLQKVVSMFHQVDGLDFGSLLG